MIAFTIARFRVGARRFLGRTTPKPADRWSVLTYAIEGGTETRRVVNDFSSALAAVRAQANTAGQMLYVRVPVHATSRQRDELWENGATLCI